MGNCEYLGTTKNLIIIRIQVNCGDFLNNRDGTYKIQNARTGLYIEKRVPSLVFGKKGMKVELSILAGNTAETKYCYANEWMASIPDDALLSSVNIPATHDTGTAGVVEDSIASSPLHHVRIFIMMNS